MGSIFQITDLRYDAQGLIPAIIQDAVTNEVLMLAYMNEQSLARTMETGVTWFYSRSRRRFWQKGESSGNIQRVKQIRTDCDQDALIIQVEQVGAGACHTGAYSCFHNDVALPTRPQE